MTKRRRRRAKSYTPPIKKLVPNANSLLQRGILERETQDDIAFANMTVNTMAAAMIRVLNRDFEFTPEQCEQAVLGVIKESRLMLFGGENDDKPTIASSAGSATETTPDGVTAEVPSDDRSGTSQ